MRSNDPAAHDGLIVIKIGGGDKLDHGAIWDDIAKLHEQGHRLLLVHGGNAALTRLQDEVGRPAHFVTDGEGRTSRYTDAEAMRLFTMAYPGEQNTNHVVALQGRGVPAVGLTGVDGAILQAKRKPAIRIVEDGKKKVLRDDHVGRIDKVDPTIPRLLLDQGYVPVITVPALAHDQGRGVAVNVDGDTAASKLALALGAERLVFLSDVPGLLRDIDDPQSLLDHVATTDAWDEAIAVGGGRMRRKVEGAQRAVTRGIDTVIFASGCVDRPIRGALAGHGTTFRAPPPATTTTEMTP